MSSSSVEQLLQEADELVQMYEYQKSVDKLHEAYQLSPNNTDVLDKLAEVLLEVGQIEDAQNLLLQSVALKPDEGFAKYMILGQINTGHDAVKYFRKGIELVKRELELKKKRLDGKLKGLKKHLISAFVSISEIYMTDLCDEVDAEDICGSALEEALKVDPENWETLQALASFRISQQNPDDAIIQINKSYNSWKDMEPDDIDRPSYDSRVVSAKLMVELEVYDLAADVLESLLEDNDEDAETWYLLAYCYSHSPDPSDIRAIPECLETSRRLLEKSGVEAASIYKQVDDLMEKVQLQIQQLPPDDEPEQEDDDAEMEDEEMEE